LRKKKKKKEKKKKKKKNNDDEKRNVYVIRVQYFLANDVTDLTKVLR